MRRPFLTKLLEWVPHTAVLRSGVKVHLRGRQDSKHFWATFTSSEYMTFLPHLSRLKIPDLRVVDCGAAIGLFSLLIEHLRRLDILDWPRTSYVLIEPSSYNVARLTRNITANLAPQSFRIHQGLVGGQRVGDGEFFESRFARWSGSVFQRSKFAERRTRRPFVDLSEHLAEPSFLKLDIEGSEFGLLEAYRDELGVVVGLIIEWHAEWGDMAEADSLLRSRDLRRAKRTNPGPNRYVDLYLRQNGGQVRQECSGTAPCA